MKSFIQRYQEIVIGALNGFDRVRFRGTFRWLSYASALGRYMSAIGVRLMEFKEFSEAATARVRESVVEVARRAGRPMEYLAKPSLSKEAHARAIAERDKIREGLIAVLYAVEPCNSFRIGKAPETGYLRVENAWRKCIHYYAYWMDADWGLCHVRMQSWLPLGVHVCLNGREWLARQMDREGIRYIRRDNCFTWVQDVERAQALLDEQLKTDWGAALNKLVKRSHPGSRAVLESSKHAQYYWSCDASEWASDVMFASPHELRGRYRRWIAHGMQNMGSREVLRFLGRHVPAQGGINPEFEGEVTTDLRERPEGIRIKHRVKKNSIKAYDKQGSVLRVETTINDTQDFKVLRRKEGQRSGRPSWRILRKGVADMSRRAQVSQAANERYLESLAAIEETTPLGELVQNLCCPVRWKKTRCRALNPLAGPDARLLEVVYRGEFAINGFRNHDLRQHLYKVATDAVTLKKQSAAITRQLRLLRAHGLIRKVPKTHRYVLSMKGRTIIAALLAARAADAEKLGAAAA
jgi:hypothetical protein